MTVNAGDLAFYRTRRGERLVCVVQGRTAKRVVIILRRGESYLLRYVKVEHLERAPGGGAAGCALRSA